MSSDPPWLDSFQLLRKIQLDLAADHIAMESEGLANTILQSHNLKDQDLSEIFSKNAKKFEKKELELNSLLDKVEEMKIHLNDIKKYLTSSMKEENSNETVDGSESSKQSMEDGRDSLDEGEQNSS